MSSAGSGLSNRPFFAGAGFKPAPVWIDHHATEKKRTYAAAEQTVHLLPAHLQTGGECSRCQMPPLLSLQPQAGKTGIHMETDGSGAVGDRPTRPTIDFLLCSGCGRCVAACPEKIITLETVGFRKNAVMVHPERCTSCGRCVIACPVAALRC